MGSKKHPVFKNADKFNGICLYLKRVEVHLEKHNIDFSADKKEIDILASIKTPRMMLCL